VRLLLEKETRTEAKTSLNVAAALVAASSGGHFVVVRQ
jgi:hypothetical protein